MRKTTKPRCRSWHKQGAFGRRRYCILEPNHLRSHMDVMGEKWGEVEAVETGAKILDLMGALKAALAK